MRVVVLGASGNVGTSVLASLEKEARVRQVIGVARRMPELVSPKVRWHEADIADANLVELFRGADAVIHAAWLIQPSHDESVMERTNIHGTARVLDAVREAKVPALIYASSVAAYSPGPKQPEVTEAWPTGGIEGLPYSQHKAEVERMLDLFEAEQPGVRVVRLRKALVFKKEAASGIRRLFMGPLFPSLLLRMGLMRVIPNVRGLLFQAVHSLDVGEAYRLAVVTDAKGAYNIAAEPVLSMKMVADLMGAIAVPVPKWVAMTALKAAWSAHLVPASEGWLEAGLESPIMDVERARTQLGWRPRFTAMEAVADLLEGLGRSSGLATPPLDPATSGPWRLGEVLAGPQGFSG